MKISKLISAFFLVSVFFLTGCGGILHTVTPAVAVHATLVDEPETRPTIQYSHPFNEKHLRELLAQRDSTPPGRGGVMPWNPDEERFEILQPGFMRTAMFWVIPPLGAIGLDRNSSVLLKVNDEAPLGLVFDDRKYYFLIRSPSTGRIEKRGQHEIVRVLHIESGSRVGSPDSFRPENARRITVELRTNRESQ